MKFKSRGIMLIGLKGEPGGEVDKTLTKEGAAADAKAVGDKLAQMSGGGGGTAADSELSETSEKPVQNKVITGRINNIEELVNSSIRISNTALVNVEQLTECVNEIVEKGGSINLFNKENEQNKNGYIIQVDVLYPIGGYSVSHPIKADIGTYTFSIEPITLGANATAVAKCDANGNIIGKAVNATNNGNNTATITIDNTWGATHFMFNIYNKNIDTVMVVKGNTMPSEYSPYREIYKLGSDINIEENITKSNLLCGKKMALNGDSICYGAGSTGGYGKFIADKYGMILQNIAVSGGTITAETYNNDGTTKRHWICRTIANMDTDADYVIVEGGVNDASLGVTLGAISSGFGSTLDETTFYGAFESMLKQLLLRFAGKKIGYIAVHQMTANYSATSNDETSYYYASKKCCEKWGVPFLDLNTQCPPWGLFQGSADETLKALKNQYTHNGDGWHPNEEGYKKYYVPKIEAWLKTL